MQPGWLRDCKLSVVLRVECGAIKLKIHKSRLNTLDHILWYFILFLPFHIFQHLLHGVSNLTLRTRPSAQEKVPFTDESSDKDHSERICNIKSVHSIYHAMLNKNVFVNDVSDHGLASYDFPFKGTEKQKDISQSCVRFNMLTYSKDEDIHDLIHVIDNVASHGLTHDRSFSEWDCNRLPRRYWGWCKQKKLRTEWDLLLLLVPF